MAILDYQGFRHKFSNRHIKYVGGYKMESSAILGVVFIVTAICMVIIKAIRENLIDKNIIFDNQCPVCQSDMPRIPRLTRHRILGLMLLVDIKYYGCNYCNKKRLFTGPR